VYAAGDAGFNNKIGLPALFQTYVLASPVLGWAAGLTALQ
jgi:hypothetical protein